MQCHRLNELLDLLRPAWQEEPDMQLLPFLEKLAAEAGFQQPINQISDDVLIYHLKMRSRDGDAAIPGLEKDYQDDFKTALLRARGIIKD